MTVFFIFEIQYLGMNVNFQFSDVIGGVYKNGNVKFLPDGTSVLSPIGNKLKMFMLKE